MPFTSTPYPVFINCLRVFQLQRILLNNIDVQPELRYAKVSKR